MSSVWVRVAELLYLMLPAYLANMAPPFVRYWKGWNPPLHRRWLGEHKTVLGFALGVTVAMAITAAQAALDAPIGRLEYRAWPLLGLAFGLGAMGGDCVKSLFKRRRRIPPGQPWIPFDQLDFAIGALLLIGPRAGLKAGDVVLILSMTFVGDVAINRISYRLGIKRTPW